MKTAVSIPDHIFEAAEQLAKRIGVSRSKLYAVALQEYLQTHRGDSIKEKLDTVYADNEDSSLDPLFVQLQAHTLPEENW